MRFASLFLLGMGAVMASILYTQKSQKKNAASLPQPLDKVKPNENITDEQIDDRLDDSFPASDPPSWSSRDMLH